MKLREKNSRTGAVAGSSVFCRDSSFSKMGWNIHLPFIDCIYRQLQINLLRKIYSPTMLESLKRSTMVMMKKFGEVAGKQGMSSPLPNLQDFALKKKIPC